MKEPMWKKILLGHNNYPSFLIYVGLALLVAMAIRSCTAQGKEFPYKEVGQAAKKGLQWGGKGTLANMREMFRIWYVIYLECGNVEPGYLSVVTFVESAGNPWSRTDDFKDLGEVGLISVKRETAKALNVDACDPCGNTWADSLMMKRARESVRSRFPFLQKYDRWESDLFADAVREAGPGTVSYFIKASGLLKNIAKVKSPFYWIFDWLTKPDLIELAAKAFGKATPPQGAFRFTWAASLRSAALKFNGGARKAGGA